MPCFGDDDHVWIVERTTPHIEVYDLLQSAVPEGYFVVIRSFCSNCDKKLTETRTCTRDFYLSLLARDIVQKKKPCEHVWEVDRIRVFCNPSDFSYWIARRGKCALCGIPNPHVDHDQLTEAAYDDLMRQAADGFGVLKIAKEAV